VKPSDVLQRARARSRRRGYLGLIYVPLCDEIRAQGRRYVGSVESVMLSWADREHGYTGGIVAYDIAISLALSEEAGS